MNSTLAHIEEARVIECTPGLTRQ